MVFLRRFSFGEQKASTAQAAAAIQVMALRALLLSQRHYLNGFCCRRILLAE
jgi:hypothetical protein